MAISDSAYETDETDESSPRESLREEHDRIRKARAVSQSGKKISREHFMAMIRARPYNPQIPATDTTQIYQTLLDLYMPEVGGDQITFKSLVVVAPSSQALSNAAKALSLSLINRVTEDPRFLTEANTVLSIALRNAHSEVSNPNTSKCVVFGIALMLSECSAIQQTSLVENTTNPHSRYLLSFMENCQAERQTENVLPTGLWNSHHRLIAALEILTERKCPCIRKTLAATHDTTSDNLVLSMTNLTLSASAVAEESDILCQSTQYISNTYVLDLLDRTYQLEREIHNEMSSYYRRSCYLPYWYADSTPAFGHVRGTGSLFRKLYDFASICSAMIHIAYWMCLSSLVQSRLSILRSFARKIDVDAAEILRLEKLFKEHASNISMSMPWFANPKNGWAGRIMAMRPLNFLLLHFRQRNEWDKVSWCVGMMKGLGIYNLDPSEGQGKGRKSKVNAQQMSGIDLIE